MKKPLVSICCLAYNHENYIRECLDGFLMQKCNFTFEVLIHDDASIDGTVNIIKEYEALYPGIIKPIYQVENQYSKGIGVSANFNFPRAKGKYIALCEGDDYWIDPYKLQKQVKFLESNPQFGLSYSYAKSLNCKTNRFNKRLNGRQFNSINKLIKSNVIPTLTAVFRKDLYELFENEITPVKKNWKMGDYPVWLFISLNSKVHFIPEVTGIYRILEESISHSSSCDKNIKFNKSVYDIKKYFVSKYDLNYPIQNLIIIRDSEILKSLILSGNKRCAIREFKKSQYKHSVILFLCTELFIRTYMIIQQSIAEKLNSQY